ncbi:hypothetical protein LBMAG40_01650 [Cyanobium sp.]|nr:hypothetical protein LBMAG40_01650 [Cyanobium sp.]
MNLRTDLQQYDNPVRFRQSSVAGENLTLPISTTVEEIEDSLIDAVQGDEDDSALVSWFLPER